MDSPGRIERIVIGSKEFSQLIGRSQRRVQQYIKEGMPALKNNQIPVAQAVQWLLEYQQGLHDLDRARQRKITAEARLAELNLEETEGELLRREEVVRQVQKILITVRNRFLALPSKLAHQLANESRAASAQAILEAEVFNALTELSELKQVPCKPRKQK